MSGKPLDTAFRALTAGIALTLILWLSQLPTDPSVAPSTIPLEVNAQQPSKSPRARITGIEPRERRRREIAREVPADITRHEIPPIPVNYGSRPAPVQIVSDRIETAEPDEPTLPEIPIPSPEAAAELPTLDLGTALPAESDSKTAEPEPARIPHELQRELDQLKDLQAQFKAVLEAKDADLHRLRQQNAELLGRLEEVQPPIESRVPTTPAIEPQRRESQPVEPLPPPDPQLPIIEPAPTPASQIESKPKDPFEESGAALKEPMPAPATEPSPPAAVSNLPLPMPNPATRPRPSPTMPFTSGRPVVSKAVPKGTCATVEEHDCKNGDKDNCEECDEDGLVKRLGPKFLRKFDQDDCEQGDVCNDCESRWGLLGKLCPYWCDSGYRQPEIFNMPAGATLLAPLDPHGEYHSTEMPDWMKIAPTPSMDETPTPPPGGGTESKY